MKKFVMKFNEFLNEAIQKRTEDDNFIWSSIDIKAVNELIKTIDKLSNKFKGMDPDEVKKNYASLEIELDDEVQDFYSNVLSSYMSFPNFKPNKNKFSSDTEKYFETYYNDELDHLEIITKANNIISKHI